METISLVHDSPDSARVEIPLFYPNGEPAGKGNFGVYETAYTLAKDMALPEGYVVSISSPLEAKDTKGIIDIGLRLTRSGEEVPNLLHIFK